MMEKRVLIASLLSAIVLIWYGQAFSRPELSRQQELTEQPVPAGQAAPAAMDRPMRAPEPQRKTIQPIGEEEVAVLGSPDLEIEVGKESASIRRVTLRKFEDLDTGEALSFETGVPLLEVQVGQGPLSWRFLEAARGTARWEGTDGVGNQYTLAISVDEQAPVVLLEFGRAFGATGQEEVTVEVLRSWTRGDDLGGRYNPLETLVQTEKERPFQREYLKYFGAQRSVRVVPRGTKLVTLGDRHFCQSLRTDPKRSTVALLPSEKDIIVVESRLILGSAKDEAGRISTEIYFGARDFFQLREAGFEHAFPVGVLGQIGLILLVILRWIAGITHNYGVAIVIFSVLITTMLAPFTVLSFKSMKKLQEMKPETDAIMAKYKAEPQRAHKEVMALYKERRVSPLSGCLPMLLQFPVLIALFNAITHFIDLRGEGFLWIRDLSLPDRLAQLPFSLPFIGEYVNALPIIMAAAMFFQTRLSKQSMPSAESNPMAKAMGGPMMSVLFGVLFYQFPSGLVLYWLMNSIMSMLWYRLAR